MYQSAIHRHLCERKMGGSVATEHVRYAAYSLIPDRSTISRTSLRVARREQKAKGGLFRSRGLVGVWGEKKLEVSFLRFPSHGRKRIMFPVVLGFVGLHVDVHRHKGTDAASSIVATRLILSCRRGGGADGRRDVIIDTNIPKIVFVASLPDV